MKVSSLLNKFSMNMSQVNKEYSHHEYLNATVEAFWVNGPTMTIMVKGVYEV